MEQSTINQRIKILVDAYAKGNKSAFARQIGISNQSLGEIIGQKQNSPSFAALQKLVQEFPEIRELWLILGTGPMLKGDSDATDSKNSDVSRDGQPATTPTESISPDLVRGQKVTIIGTMAVRDYYLKGEGGNTLDPPAAQEPAAPPLGRPAPAGTDLVQLVAQHDDQLDQHESRLSQHQTELAELRQLITDLQQP